MTIDQISVVMENKAGQLAKITSLLTKEQIDMRALNIAENSNYGVLRLITSEPIRTVNVLMDNGFTISKTAVLGIAVPDKPGGLCGILQKFADNDIDVDYMYSVIGQQQGLAYMIFRVAEPEKVEAILQADGIQQLTTADLRVHG